MSTVEYNNLVIHHAESLRSFAYNLTRDVDDANDLIQDTLFKAITKRQLYQEGTNLKAWLYTIMKNIFINNYRRKARSNTLIDQTSNLFHINSTQTVTKNKAESDLVVEDIEKNLAYLSEEIRKPFIMHFQGFKYHEIAEELGIPIGTVKSRIFLARAEMKKRLMDYATN